MDGRGLKRPSRAIPEGESVTMAKRPEGTPKGKLIVVSVDAMTGEELSELLTLQNASRLSGGARVGSVRPVYPTLTYPCHAAMLTGCYPWRTGISGNQVFSPGARPMPWHWERHHNRETDDLLFAAKRAGLTTASVFWPGTGKHPACDHLIPEYWPQGPGDSVASAMARMGASPGVLEILREFPCPDLSRHPEADESAMRWAAEILRRFHPDVLLTHPANLDEAKHLLGERGPHVSRALREADAWIGWLMRAAEENGDGDTTNFVLTSDHGQRSVNRVFAPNVLLREAGLLEANAAGNLTAWRAFCLPGGMCFEVRLRDKESRLKNRVRALLESWGGCGVSRVYTRKEAEAEERLSGEFDFFCEMDGETAVSGALTGAALRRRAAGDPAATHGYHPDRGPQPSFYGRGPAFAGGAFLEDASLTDEAPTLAAALGLRLPRAEGRVLWQLLSAPSGR